MKLQNPPQVSISRIHQSIRIPQYIEDAYRQEHRRYHDYYHIQYMLDLLANTQFNPESLAPMLYTSIAWAVMYHDYVYNVPDPDKQNEELSAQAFEDHFAHEHTPLVQYVARAIRGTKTHIILDEEIDKFYFIIASHLFDLDLWALGDETIYKRNNYLIQQEVGVDDEQWAVGRSAWLESFMARQRIYYTELGQSRESSARKILEADYKQLQSVLGK